MEHVFTQELETPRLLLRRFREDDAPAMLANWAQDPEVTRYLDWEPHKSLWETQTILMDWCKRYSEDSNWYQWAIVPRELGEPIGSISVVQQSEKHGWLEIGYCIGRAWWGKGIVAEALKAVTDFLFTQVKPYRIQLICDCENIGSARVMEKAGYVREGRMAQSHVTPGLGVRDHYLYARTLREFEADAAGDAGTTATAATTVGAANATTTATKNNPEADTHTN